MFHTYEPNYFWPNLFLFYINYVFCFWGLLAILDKCCLSECRWHCMRDKLTAKVFQTPSVARCLETFISTSWLCGFDLLKCIWHNMLNPEYAQLLKNEHFSYPTVVPIRTHYINALIVGCLFEAIPWWLKPRPHGITRRSKQRIFNWQNSAQTMN